MARPGSPFFAPARHSDRSGSAEPPIVISTGMVRRTMEWRNLHGAPPVPKRGAWAGVQQRVDFSARCARSK